MTTKQSSTERGRFVRAARLAEYVSLSRSTLYRLSKEGKFPRPIKLSDNATVWDLDEVDAWIEARRNVQGGAA